VAGLVQEPHESPVVARHLQGLVEPAGIYYLATHHLGT